MYPPGQEPVQGNGDGAVDVDEVMAQVQAAASGHTDGTWHQIAENIVFRMLGLMLTENGDSAARKTSRQNLWNVFLFVVDFLQLSGIMLGTDTGFTFSWSFLEGWRSLSILRLFGIDSTHIGAFITIWALAVAIMVLSVANAAYVAWQVRVGFSGSLAPVRTLRTAVAVLLTAGYVALLEIVAEPLSCERLQTRAPNPEAAIPCWGFTHMTLFAVSLPVLIAFVAFALLMRAVYFQDAPLSPSVMAKPIARNEFWDTVARTTLVLLSLFLPSTNPMLMVVLYALMYSALTVQAVLHLPYFKLAMTQLRVATYCALVWMALGSVLIQSLRGNGWAEADVESSAIVWLSFTFLVLFLGAFVAWWRQRSMERKGIAIAKYHMNIRQRERAAAKAQQQQQLQDGEESIDGSGVGSSNNDNSEDDEQVSLAIGGVPRFHLPQAADSGAGVGAGVGGSSSSPAAKGFSDEHRLSGVGVDAALVDKQDESDAALAQSADREHPSLRIPAFSHSLRAGASPEAKSGKPASGVVSATAAVAHAAGQHAMRRQRLRSANEAEDVTELMGRSKSSGMPSGVESDGGFGDSMARTGPGSQGHRRRRPSQMSVDDDDSLTASMKRKATRMHSRNALQVAVEMDEDDGRQARGAFVSTPVAADRDTKMGLATESASKPSEGGSGPSVKAASTSASPGRIRGRRASAAAAIRPSRSTGSNVSAAGMLERSAAPAGAGMQAAPQQTEQPPPAVSSFVLALRSELGHTKVMGASKPSRDASQRFTPNSSIPVPESVSGNSVGNKRSPTAKSRRLDTKLLENPSSSSSSKELDGKLAAQESKATPSKKRGRRFSMFGPLGLPKGPEAPQLDPLAIEDEDVEEDPELDELLSGAPNQLSLESHSSHFWSSDTDVELFVRALLARPTQRRLAYARVVLDEALMVFPDSVFVRLTFTTYLFSRSTTYSDIILAMRLLTEASGIPASLDLRFAVFSKLNGALNARRRMVLGNGTTGSKQDSLDLVEFKKGVKFADDKHREAITLLLSYWTSVAHGGTDGVTIRGASVTDSVGAISQAADAAEKAYLQVLERWPGSQPVQRAYGIFLINVRNDKELGEAYLSLGENADDDGGDGNDRSTAYTGSRGGGMGGGHSVARSSRSGASLTSVDNIKRRRLKIGASGNRIASTLKDIARMRGGFRLGLMGLLAIIIGMFVLCSVLFSTIRQTVSVIDQAGKRRSHVENALLHTRSLRLAAVENDLESYRNLQLASLEDAESFHTITDGLYFEGPQPKTIRELWTFPTIPISFWNPDPPPGESNVNKVGLLDASSLFIASTARVARKNISRMQGPWDKLPQRVGSDVGDADPFYSLLEYRFVIDNSRELLEQLNFGVERYQFYTIQTALTTDYIMFALTGLRFLILLVLAWCVVLPAIEAIRGQKLILRSLVVAVPRRVASHLARRFKSVNKALSEVTSTVNSLEELDPTTKVYATLRDTSFLVTMPKLKNRSEKGKRGRKARNRTLSSDEEDAADGGVAGRGRANKSGAPMVSRAGEPMHAIVETSDEEEEEEESHTVSQRSFTDAKAAPYRVKDSAHAAGMLDGSLREDAKAAWAEPRQQAPPAKISAPAKPSHTAAVDTESQQRDPADCGTESPIIVADGGGFGELVSESDLLESVHDADELAALMARRRDAKALKDVAPASDSGMVADGTQGTGVSSLHNSEEHFGGGSGANMELDDLLESDPQSSAAPGGPRAVTGAARAEPITVVARGLGSRPRTSSVGDDSSNTSGSRPAMETGEPISSVVGVATAAAAGTTGFVSAAHSNGVLAVGQTGLRGALVHRSSSHDANHSGRRLSQGGPTEAPAEPKPAAVAVEVASKQQTGITVKPAVSQGRLTRIRSHFEQEDSDDESSGRKCCAGGGQASCLAGCCIWCGCRRPVRRRRRLSSSSKRQMEQDKDEIQAKLGVCTAPSLRRIALRAAVVLTALMGLMGATTYVFYASAEESSSKAAQINNAGRRRSLATQSVNLLRELIISDGQLDTHEELVARMEETLTFYERVHNGLRLGDEGLGLSASGAGAELSELSHLYYGTPGSGFEVDSTDPLGITDFSAIGLDPLLRHFWVTSRRVLETYRNVSAPRPERTLSGLLSLEQFRALSEMQSGVLSEMLGRAVEIYSTADIVVIDGLEVQAYIVLSVEMVVLAIAYMVVYEGISTAVVSEHLRSKDVRDFIPPLIRKGTPALVAAFEAVDGKGSSRILTGRG